MTLCKLLPDHDLRLLISPTGRGFVKEVGIEVIRGVVLDIMSGRNLRDSTEALTRKRIGALNLALVDLFLQGSVECDGFVEKLPYVAADTLKAAGGQKAERLLAQWALGLTNKGVQNILRDRAELVDEYRDKFVAACRDVVEKHEHERGAVSGALETQDGLRIELDWLALTYLLSMAGAQTLATRGSQKSAYGKLFEKLILGSLLFVLGFKQVTPENAAPYEKVFWLSSREGKRESDATLLYEKGKGVRFDIGFIGKGNPEISLDKVTRFDHMEELRKSEWYMATIIIVDRIGDRSKLQELAKAANGEIVQMSASYWPREVAQILHDALGHEHALLKMDDHDMDRYLAESLKQAPLEEFIGPGSSKP